MLKSTFRESDVIARIGGDEFVVLFIGAAREISQSAIKRFNEAVNTRNDETNEMYSLSISVGTSYTDPVDNLMISDLLGRADKEMYKQKKGRKSKAPG